MMKETGESAARARPMRKTTGILPLLTALVLASLFVLLEWSDDEAADGERASSPPI